VAPKVTVVIPVWDAYAGDGLLAAVASVRAQSPPADLIVVDNASRVPLPALESVEIVRLERRGSTGAARNAALERVRSPYVVFLDADDELLSGGLAALVEGIDADRRRAVYVLSIIDGVTGRRHRSPRRLARVLSSFPTLFALVNTIWSLLPTQGATVMRAGDVRACGGYADSDRGEDWVLATSLAFRGRVAFDRRPGLCYRRREDSPGTAALTPAVLLANARRVRARVRDDPAVAAWTKSLLPLIAAAQWVAARLAYPGFRRLRAFLSGGHTSVR
jgi:glycosyltransferase involved in cell wall biosynthesis